MARNGRLRLRFFVAPPALRELLKPGVGVFPPRNSSSSSAPRGLLLYPRRPRDRRRACAHLVVLVVIERRPPTRGGDKHAVASSNAWLRRPQRCFFACSMSSSCVVDVGVLWLWLACRVRATLVASMVRIAVIALVTLDCA